MSHERDTAASKKVLQDAWSSTPGGAAIAGYSEWLSFIHDRLQKDLALAQRLSLCRDPNDVSRACVEFWTEAAHDYQEEAIRIGKMHLATWSAVQEARAQRETRQGSGKDRLSRAA